MVFQVLVELDWLVYQLKNFFGKSQLTLGLKDKGKWTKKRRKKLLMGVNFCIIYSVKDGYQ